MESLIFLVTALVGGAMLVGGLVFVVGTTRTFISRKLKSPSK